jgi:hypothetical protein
VLARAVEAQDRQRVDLAVDLTDALLQHVEQLERRHFAGSKLVDDGACGLVNQILTRQLFRSTILFAIPWRPKGEPGISRSPGAQLRTIVRCFASLRKDG